MVCYWAFQKHSIMGNKLLIVNLLTPPKNNDDVNVTINGVIPNKTGLSLFNMWHYLAAYLPEKKPTPFLPFILNSINMVSMGNPIIGTVYFFTQNGYIITQ